MISSSAIHCLSRPARSFRVPAGLFFPAAVYAMIVGAGFGEETVFRRYLFERFDKLFGSRVWAKTIDGAAHRRRTWSPS